MRKISSILLLIVCVIASLCLVSCNQNNGETGNENDTTIIVGATAAPHAEILEFAKPLLAEKGYTLQIEVFSKYELLNPGLSGGRPE